MKSKINFTKQEYETIIQLINDKLKADASEQKTIRDTIRRLGFHFTDFYKKGSRPYDVEAFTSLFQSGKLKLIVGQTQKTPTVSAIEKYYEKGQKGKNDKSEIKDDFKNGLAAWVDENSEILILGSLPGDDSIKAQSYYCNPSNQFWKIMSALFNKGEEISGNKKEFILKHKIALWDCLKSAIREGSSDSDIKSGEPNDLSSFLKNHPRIKTIIVNGKGVKEDYFDEYFKNISDKEYQIRTVTSTSGAAAKSLENRILEWKNVLSGVIS